MDNEQTVIERDLPVIYIDDEFQEINAIEPNGYDDPNFTSSDSEPF